MEYTRRVWVRYREADGLTVYWGGQIRGWVTNLALALEYGSRPTLMGDEKACQVEVTLRVTSW